MGRINLSSIALSHYTPIIKEKTIFLICFSNLMRKQVSVKKKRENDFNSIGLCKMM